MVNEIEIPVITSDGKFYYEPTVDKKISGPIKIDPKKFKENLEKFMAFLSKGFEAIENKIRSFYLDEITIGCQVGVKGDVSILIFTIGGNASSSLTIKFKRKPDLEDILKQTLASGTITYQKYSELLPIIKQIK